MLKTVLFDLDGTLLPMDQDVFTRAYFHSLAAKLAPHGYEPKALIDGIWAGMTAMVENDGGRTNEEAFWKRFSEKCGDRVLQDGPVFDEYYRVEFQQVAPACGFNPQAREIVDELKRAGYRVALATNPIFPTAATQSRIRWAGLEPEDFALYTTYENSHYCKPNPAYYREVLSRLGAGAEECLMVGNDVQEDMAAQSVGMNVFLLTDCLINKGSRDITVFERGGFDELRRYIKGGRAR